MRMFVQAPKLKHLNLVTSSPSEYCSMSRLGSFLKKRDHNRSPNTIFPRTTPKKSARYAGKLPHSLSNGFPSPLLQLKNSTPKSLELRHLRKVVLKGLELEDRRIDPETRTLNPQTLNSKLSTVNSETHNPKP